MESSLVEVQRGDVIEPIMQRWHLQYINQHTELKYEPRVPSLNLKITL